MDDRACQERIESMINFNIPPVTGNELQYIQKAIGNRKICGDGEFTKKCSQWMEERFKVQKVLMTTSGTSALDLAVMLCDLKEGDEVILPSFTFSSTATAPLLSQASLVFVDLDPKTMNIDPERIREAITDKTKVVIIMHYGGISCDMDKIMDIVKEHNLILIEDAAQGVMASFKGKALGTFGDFGCYSFHETKNYSMGEGGALLINNPQYNERAEILREKGTDRSKFNRGQVDKYTWVDRGDSFLPSELNTAYLFAQLEQADQINEDRKNTWNFYYSQLEDLQAKRQIELPYLPEGAQHNAHLFYIKTKDLEERSQLIQFAREQGVQLVFHYIPLHSAPAGLKYGRMSGEDQFTTVESERLVRLPMYYGMTSEDAKKTVSVIREFYENR